MVPMFVGIIPWGTHHMITAIRSAYPDFVALRCTADLGRYETAVEKFAKGGSRSDLMTTMFGLGIPANQIRTLASYPGSTLPAMCGE